MKIKTEEITSKLLSKNDIKLYVKRIDLIDKYISGNKWYKLKEHGWTEVSHIFG